MRIGKILKSHLGTVVILLFLVCISKNITISADENVTRGTTGGESILLSDNPLQTTGKEEGTAGVENSSGAVNTNMDTVINIDKSGNVGFNTTAPETDIHIYAKDEKSTSIRLEGDSTRDGSYREYTTITRDADALRFIDDDGGEVFTIMEPKDKDSGLVGINIAKPEVELHIYTKDEKSTSIRLEGNSARDGSYREYTTITRDADALRFIDDDGGEVFTIMENNNGHLGQIGINTPAPTEQLEVNGTIKATKFYSIKGETPLMTSGQIEAIFDTNDDEVWKVYVFGKRAVAEATVFGVIVKNHQFSSSTFNESVWKVFSEQGSIKVRFTDVHNLSDRARWVALRIM
ncbi:MAG: hypothetical protein MRK02_14900 [Candidatus Scalindua sp.]|nr:hypothetical protein [Candidatus Scalindua sp.]